MLIRLIDDMDVLVPNGDTPRISRHLMSNKDTIFEVLPGISKDYIYKKGISYKMIHLIWYKKLLKYMPLYICDPYFQVIAHWRLKINK